ncbi:MAG TPA: PKD domain-containing protein, partial [Luteolibacter sp.]
LGLNFRSEGFAADGNKFVSVGYDWNGSVWFGKIHHSTDGKLWQSATMPATEEIRDVAAGNGVFVAVGDAGTILHSSDGGATWTSQTAPGAASLSGIAYGGGVFIAVGDTAVYTSPDGISWTDRSAGTGIASWHSFKDVAFTHGSFIAGGWYSGLRISTDGGITWQTTTIVGGADYDVKSIAVGGGAIVATAERKTATTGPVLLVSQNGLIWEQSKVASFPSTSTVAFGDGVYMTVYGSAGASSQSGAFYPLNTAPAASITAPSTGNARQSISFSANTSDPNGNPLTLIWDFKDGTALREGTSVTHTFPVGGSYSVDLIATDTLGGVTTASHSITITDPLNTWTQRTSGTTAVLRDIAFGGGKLVVVGESGGTYRTSTDGVAWTGGAMGGNVYLNGIIYSGSQFVAVGVDYDFNTSLWTGAIYTSPNGTTWTRRHFSGKELNEVAYGGGAYVAVGNSGAMWKSTDGISWSPVSSGITSENINAISYGNGGFVAVGSAGSGGTVVSLASTDGSNWTNTSGGAGVANWQGFDDVEFCNDRFLASGWYSKIRHSTNGG